MTQPQKPLPFEYKEALALYPITPRTSLFSLFFAAVLLTTVRAGADLEKERARDAGPKDGQAGDLEPWEEVDGMTEASTPGPSGGDGVVVEEGCDCDTEQCSQAPGAAPVVGAAGLFFLKRRRGRRRRP